MKLGIVTIALAALALTMFASSDADANGQHMVMHLSGGNFITSTVDGQPTPLDGQPFTALQSGIARGPGGVADFLSQAVIDAIPQDPSMFPPACLAQGLAGSTLSTTLVVSYKDGSLLSMTTDDGSYFCTDGTTFTVSFGGNVTGGEGRFDGASGTWEGTAEAVSGRVVSELHIDLAD